MIFDKDLDRALWAMMAGCSDNRSDIAYFIKTLPKEIIMDIRRALEDKKQGFFDISNYSNRYLKSGFFNYKYSIDVVNSTLMLKVVRYKTYINKTDGNEHVLHEEEFQLNLNMLYPALIHNVKKEYIGNFIAKSSKVNFEDDIYKGIIYKYVCGNYELIGTIFGKFIKTTDNEINNLSYVNFDKCCPNELYFADFASKDRVMNLVKNKKR